MDVDTFRSAAGSFASGVTVIASAAGGRMHGMTASAVCSLSLKPTLMLVCMDKNATTLGLIREAGRFSINVLSAEQGHLAQAFAARGNERENLMTANAIVMDGTPIVQGCAAFFQCRLVEELAGGDHSIIVGEVTAAASSAEQSPLVYFRGQYGHFAPRPK